MNVTWEVEDGYVGKSRPHTTHVPDEELRECETDEERMDLIEDYVLGDFEQKIGFCIIRTSED